MELIIQKIYARVILHVNKKLTITTSLRHPSFFYCMMGSRFWSVKWEGFVRLLRWIIDAWCAPKFMGMRTLSVGFMILGFRLGFMYHWGKNPEIVAKFEEAKRKFNAQ